MFVSYLDGFSLHVCARAISIDFHHVYALLSYLLVTWIC